VNVCQCRADELCVLEACVPIGQVELIDAASGGDASATTDALSQDGFDAAGSRCAEVTARIAELRHGAATGADGADSGFDFVELEGDAGASLAGWRLVITDPQGAARPDVWLSGALSGGGAEAWAGRWLATWGAAAGSTLPASAWVGGAPLPSPLGRVALLDCEGVERDAITYGRWPEGGAGAAEPTAPGESLGRCPGDNGDGAGAGFVVTASPTPGAPNATLADAPACTPCEGWAGEGASAWLSEMMADGDSRGYLEARLAPAASSPAAFGLELWSVSLEAWRSVGPLMGTASADGVLLITSGDAFTLPSQGAAARLVGCQRAVIDAVGYGDASAQAGLTPAQVIDAATSGQAVSRCPDAPDGAWSGEPEPSPGAPNVCP
jgi:hypothetical protein